MPSLAETLTAPLTRPKVVQACVDLVESEVASKGGLGGMAIKAGYKVVKTVKPGMVPRVVEILLPEFAEALQGIYDRSTAGRDDAADAFTRYIVAHPDETAEALLTVTDARTERAKNATLKATYSRLRGSAAANVVAAIPGLAKALRPFL